MKIVIALLTTCIACYAQDPAIYSLTLSKQLTLDSKNINMIPNMAPNTETTTPLGASTFTSTNEGIMVSKSGLYRVTVFQKTYATTPNSCCIVMLMIGNTIKRYKAINLGLPVDEIHFTHVLRMNAGEKLQFILRPSLGPVELETGTDSSGFTIEAISNEL